MDVSTILCVFIDINKPNFFGFYIILLFLLIYMFSLYLAIFDSGTIDRSL